MSNKKLSIQLNTFVYRNDVHTVPQKINARQKVTFVKDEFIKDKVVMNLTSDVYIHAPNHDVYFDKEQLKEILEFLINDKT